MISTVKGYSWSSQDVTIILIFSGTPKDALPTVNRKQSGEPTSTFPRGGVMDICHHLGGVEHWLCSGRKLNKGAEICRSLSEGKGGGMV